jgi:aspartyl-tRNA synthetase
MIDGYRSDSCGELRLKDEGKKILLGGWVNRRRDHGGLIFIDMRDRSGLVQVVFEPNYSKDSFTLAQKLRNEYVILVEGVVRRRAEGMENPNLPTGEIEIIAERLEILNESKTPPFPIELRVDTSEELRLRYRFLDLRRPQLQSNIILRHRVVKAARDFLDEKGFLEIETPMLTKSTPEGARDFLVPSRLNPGNFYALPQSPQLFKQLLMVSGFERYFQIARCFRDEDLRADRQPEFTQIDIEMSFAKEETIMGLMEQLIARLFKVAGKEMPLPVKKMSFQEAMNKYGSDKPDLRFGLEFVDVSHIVKESGFKVFANAVQSGGTVNAINAKGAGRWPRREIDLLAERATQMGAKGLAWIAVGEGELRSAITKYLTEAEQKDILEALKAEPGDLLLFMADAVDLVHQVLGRLRLVLGEKLGLIDHNQLNFVWIVDWPLLEYDKELGRFVAVNHPFTSPKDSDVDMLTTEPAKVRAKAYDLVVNGIELGGGSIRIHDRSVQEKMFQALGLSEGEAQDKFGFLLEAFEYGAPPHGGIAFGLDRLIMVLSGSDSIRECIAFPKTQSGTCLLTQAPSMVNSRQLEELHIRLAPQIKV